jgi:HTH-type transcriptional regulator/antitoxin HigA
LWASHAVAKAKRPTKKQVLELAHQMEIHPALVAGRIRYERGNYKLLSGLVGNGEVRKFFV